MPNYKPLIRILFRDSLEHVASKQMTGVKIPFVFALMLGSSGAHVRQATISITFGERATATQFTYRTDKSKLVALDACIEMGCAALPPNQQSQIAQKTQQYYIIFTNRAGVVDQGCHYAFENMQWVAGRLVAFTITDSASNFEISGNYRKSQNAGPESRKSSSGVSTSRPIGAIWLRHIESRSKIMPVPAMASSWR